MKPRFDLLTILADYLDTVDPYNFNMDYWENHQTCGTTACAIGYACQLKEFKDAGIKLGKRRSGWEPEYYGRWYFDAVSKCLQIKRIEASTLFSDPLFKSPKSTPKDIAERIRQFIKDKIVENSNRVARSERCTTREKANLVKLEC